MGPQPSCGATVGRGRKNKQQRRAGATRRRWDEKDAKAGQRAEGGPGGEGSSGEGASQVKAEPSWRGSPQHK